MNKSVTARRSIICALAAALAPFAAPTAHAQESRPQESRPLAAATVPVYPPIQGASVWDRFGETPPSSHHRVFSNWGYLNDWSVDIYQNPGATVVSPFGSKTSSGSPVTVQVVTVTPGCATGNLADGGWRIGLEARDDATGTVVGRADVMHVDQKPDSITVGATVGPWDRLGRTGRFRYSSCYQVNGDTGAHIHLEVINRTAYSCYVARSAGVGLSDETVVGHIGTSNSGPQQSC
ncbi:MULTISPECIES: hypothetical protein [Streptomyces]|uniref:hypothetical protein n=1 Tax=Streptomyces TaxID=1883 RepID=UPI000B41EDB9|nr:hypothetical protein [Streptomyces sp. CS057]OWA25755.1 hypothetical protein B9W61_05655 [Streptomyces sp. CS057]